MTCGRCKTEIADDAQEYCWWCLGELCYECWDRYGDCCPDAVKAFEEAALYERVVNGRLLPIP